MVRSKAIWSLEIWNIFTIRTAVDLSVRVCVCVSVCVCLSVCLSCLYSNFSQAWRRKLICGACTFSKYLGQVYISRSYGEGQRHRSKTNEHNELHTFAVLIKRQACLQLFLATCNWDRIRVFPSVLWHCWFGHLACKNRLRNDL